MTKREYIRIYGTMGYTMEQKLLNPWEEFPLQGNKKVKHLWNKYD
jgi:hypothetical protein